MAFKFELCNTWKAIHDDAIECICIHPDGRYLASGGNDCKLVIWDTATTTSLHHILASSAVVSLIWGGTQANVILLCGTEDGTLFSVRFNEHRIEVTGYHEFPKAIKYLEINYDILDTAPSGDMKRFLAIDNCPNVTVWRWDEDNAATPWSEHRTISPPIHAGFKEMRARTLAGFKWLHDDQRHCIAIGWVCYGISILDIETKQWTRTILMQNCGPFDISAGNKLVAVCEVKTGFSIYDASNGQPLLSLEDSEMTVPDAAVPVSFSCGSQLLCLGSTAGKVHCWSSEDYEVGKPHEYMQPCQHENSSHDAGQFIVKGLCIYYRRTEAQQITDIRIYTAGGQSAAKNSICEFRTARVDYPLPA